MLHDSTLENLAQRLSATFQGTPVQTVSPVTATASVARISPADIPYDVAVYEAAPYRLDDADFRKLVQRSQTDLVDRED